MEVDLTAPEERSDDLESKRSWFPARSTSPTIWLLEPGDTVNGNRHPGLDYDETAFQALLGIHVARKRFALHLTYYYYPSEIAKPVVPPPPGTESTGTSLEWVNVSLEYRW